ncbi:hypothetical protein [Streptomyces mirabilis]|uniref:hypothetical protein n=1 Tax=Streptomyces mirabilis TaxID=68239 RepID=UPI0036768B30
MTLLIAGHDTTAGALAWALHQLELPLVFADDGSAVQASPNPLGMRSSRHGTTPPRFRLATHF